MERFVIATHNENKRKEMQRILEPLGILVETANLRDVEEIGTTFAENAALKAQAACEQTGRPAIADDSGLMVDALGGAPGIYSARYAGEHASDQDRIAKLLAELASYPEPEQRKARFVCSVCCAFPNGDVIRAEGTCEGRIGFAPRGTNGFGYDPIFFRDARSFAELSKEEKDAVSHRGKALEQFVQFLKQYYTKEK